jgi:3-deoxy-D-manno-octulosonic-acid transferase
MSYRLLIAFLAPVFLIYTIRLAIKFKSLIYFKQRLGFSCAEFKQQPIWIHCASVGEVNTFIPLLEIFIQRLPQQPFLITTNTVTGAATLEKHPITNTQHCYLPIENSYAIKRFLNKTQPKLALIMETEIWPLLFFLINKKNIPLSIINGRLSVKTINTANWIKKLYRSTLKHVDIILARSEQDYKAFKKLGGDAIKVQEVGNLKFSQPRSSSTISLKNFTNREYILAASTHNDEELQLANLWEEINLRNTLLVIVPRHPDRGIAIFKQLSALGLNVAIRSKGDTITKETHIYIADTLGELSEFMNHAEIVFMGGSLISHGGQNLLEAAQLGKAIIVGPHMHNFQNEVDLFKQQHACIQVNNTSELGTVIQSLLIDSNNRTSLGHCAEKIMSQQTGIAEIYLNKLQEVYPDSF